MQARVAKRQGSRTKDAQERRSDILAAATQLFREKGITETSIESITEKAGIAKGTFYLHFESKDHVVARLWEVYLEGFVSIVRQRLDAASQHTRWRPLFADLLEQLVTHALDHAELHRTIYRTADAKALDLCREMNSRTMALIARVIERGVDTGEFQCSNPELTTSLVYHGADGLLHEVILGSRSMPKAEIVRTIQEFGDRALQTE
jgi:AcrR family transcriptional regulator